MQVSPAVNWEDRKSRAYSRSKLRKEGGSSGWFLDDPQGYSHGVSSSGIMHHASSVELIKDNRVGLKAWKVFKNAKPTLLKEPA